MKYFSKKCEYKGIAFDSRAERDRYILLSSLQDKGMIEGLELQKEFEILPKQIGTRTVTLKTKTKEVEYVDEQAVKYHADFFYYDVTKQRYVIEELKSKMTMKVRDYPLRRKLVKLMVRRINDKIGYEQFEFSEVIAK